MEKIESQIFDLLQDKPLTFSIKLSEPNFLQKIFKKTTKDYVIKPLVLHKYFEIAKLLEICKELIIPDNDNNLLANSIEGIIKYKDEILQIVSLFINETKRFILKNLDIKDLQKLFVQVLQLNDHTNFFFILTTAKNQMTMKIPKAEK